MGCVSNQLLDELIRCGIDDRDLYGVAADQVREPGLRQVLHENHDALEAVVEDLQRQALASGHQPPRHGTLRGWLQCRLGGWLARRGGDPAWIRLLAQSEALYRRKFESGLERLPQETRPRLQRWMRELEADMRSLSRPRWHD